MSSRLPQKQHVFLSYTHADKVSATNVRSGLLRAGYHVWQDQTEIKGGDEWIVSIEEGINAAYALITIISVNWERSRWVRNEVQAAFDRRIPVIPVLLDTAELPLELKTIQAITLMNRESQGIEELCEVLATYREAAARDNERLQHQHEQEQQRQREIEYLNGMLLRSSVFAQTYTPLSGAGPRQILAENRISLPPDWYKIGTRFHDELDLIANSHAARREEKIYDDLVPAVLELRQLAMLGESGSGKTATFWFTVWQLANQAKVDPVQPLPVFISLNELTTTYSLHTAIQHVLEEFHLDYQTLFKQGRLALLLDGLNEIKPEIRQTALLDMQALIRDCQQRQLIALVSCREADYVGSLDVHIPRRLRIAPLDPIRIKRFIDRWFFPEQADTLFWELAGEKAHSYWNDFVKHVGNFQEVFWNQAQLPPHTEWGDAQSTWDAWIIERQHPRSLLALASNPFMLAKIIKIFDKLERIPQNRSILLRLSVDALLDQLEEREALEQGAVEDLKLHLAALAYQTMRTVGQGSPFPRSMALTYLDDHQIYLARVASILSGTAEELRFAHQLFQEFFAALAIAEQHVSPFDLPTLFPADAGRHVLAGWEETLIFFAGLLSEQKMAFTTLMQSILDLRPDIACRVIPDSIGEQNITPAMHQQVVERCRAYMRSPHVPLAQRYQVGIELSALQTSLRSHSEHFIWIEGKMAHTSLEGFYIARHPVTNREFQAFIDNGGYITAAYWGDFWEWAQRHIPDRMPYFYQRLRPEWKYADAPVVGICWYEALAFCSWKNATLNRVGLPQQWIVRLPKRSEWVRAVRGDAERNYPWGNDDADVHLYCQFQGSGLPGPAPVGIYPLGYTPEGITDLMGNVFEFGYPQIDEHTCICRGGSWLEGIRRLEFDSEEKIAADERSRVDVGFRYVYAKALS